MILSDISVKRPVFATVISLLLVCFGLLSFLELPLREYPDTSSPVVSISASYPGASAEVVETQVTQLLEDQINGIEGIASITSSSRDGSASVSVEFNVGYDIEVGANDIREKISRITQALPEDVDPPQISKADNDSRPIQYLNLRSTQLNFLELNDYANRFLVDQFAIIDGVANVQINGNGGYAMRIWLDRQALAARQLTVTDVASALRRENIEVPAGRIESTNMELTVRVERIFQTPGDFSRLVIARGQDGHLITLGEIARIELGAANNRMSYQGNGEQAVGLGVVKQSTANSLQVMQDVARKVEEVQATLPSHMELFIATSDAAFIENAIDSVYETIFMTMILVSIVIYMFLGSVRSMIIPAITIPVCLIASFIVLSIMDLSINLITLLALVLSVGLIVDDSIVVLENIQRRVALGEPPLLAAFKGARQVAFAVIATTVVLIAVFVPVIFMDGNMGILLYELAFTIGAAVVFSSVLALSLTPMMSSKLLKSETQQNWLTQRVDKVFTWLQDAYQSGLQTCLKASWAVLPFLAVIGLAIYALLQQVPSTFAPSEDQGVFITQVSGPQGAGIEYMEEQINLMQAAIEPLKARGEVENVISMVPGWGGGSGVNAGIVFVALPDWAERDKSTQQVMTELNAEWAKLPGVQAFSFMRSGIGRGGSGQPVQFVIGGRSYEELVQWRDILIQRARESGMFTRPDSDFNENKPSLSITVDKVRAADLGVSIQAIGQTLQAMMSESRVTTFADLGEEYDVILQAEQSQRQSPDDLTNIYVRSDTSGRLVPLSNLVTIANSAGPDTLSRYNRVRSITISAGLAPGVRLEDALGFLENVVREELPEYAQINYKGESLDLKNSGGDLAFIVAMSLIVVLLVLAAQFESFIHPLVIMTTVPLAFFGALLGIYLTGGSLNIYSNIGLIILVGIASKNGILIVEFINQLRDTGHKFNEAILYACKLRLRPVLMTALSTIMGAVPLIMSTGAGSESRIQLGIVIFSGVLMTTLMTLFVVPVMYKLIARHSGSPEAVAKALKLLQGDNDTLVPTIPGNNAGNQVPATTGR